MSLETDFLIATLDTRTIEELRQIALDLLSKYFKSKEQMQMLVASHTDQLYAGESFQTSFAKETSKREIEAARKPEALKALIQAMIVHQASFEKMMEMFKKQEPFRRKMSKESQDNQ